jgi:hypothetical protein
MESAIGDQQKSRRVPQRSAKRWELYELDESTAPHSGSGTSSWKDRKNLSRSQAMTHIELRTRVGPDGILNLSVPVGMSEANPEVNVIVKPASAVVGRTATMTPEDWARFVDETAGAWWGDLERPEQGELEVRDQWP